MRRAEIDLLYPPLPPGILYAASSCHSRGSSDSKTPSLKTSAAPQCPQDEVQASNCDIQDRSLVVFVIWQCSHVCLNSDVITKSSHLWLDAPWRQSGLFWCQRSVKLLMFSRRTPGQLLTPGHQCQASFQLLGAAFLCSNSLLGDVRDSFGVGIRIYSCGRLELWFQPHCFCALMNCFGLSNIE